MATAMALSKAMVPCALVSAESSCHVRDASLTSVSFKQSISANRLSSCGSSADFSSKVSSSNVFQTAARRCSNAPAAVAQETAPASTEQKTTYHFLVANAKFMLDDEEHFQEQMNERLRYFKDMGREQDFWLTYEPDFLNDFPEITKRLSRPAVALVSTDGVWMTFMRLRLDRVLKGEFTSEKAPEEVLASKPVVADFEKPQTWVAPYSKYEGPWWTPFLPKSSA